MIAMSTHTPQRWALAGRASHVFAALGLAAACADAQAVVTITTGYRGPWALSLRVGPAAGVETVRFNVQGKQVGNSLAAGAIPESGTGNAVAADGNGVYFRLLAQMPTIPRSARVTVTATSPGSLTCESASCTGYSIPFSAIRWEVQPSPSGPYAFADWRSGRFPEGVGPHTMLFFTFNPDVYGGGSVEVVSTLRFTYDNSTAYPAGIYNGTVTYTASFP